MEKHVCFFSQSISLAGIVSYPNEKRKKYPTVILCHGHSRHKNDGLDRLSALLNSNGILTFRFDFRGCGETVLNKCRVMPQSEWPVDLKNAITFVIESIEQADSRRIGLVGISMGASTVIHVAGTDKRVTCIASMAGIGDCERHLKRVFDTKRGKDGFQELIEKIERDKIKQVTTGHSSFVTAAYIGGDCGEAEADYLVDNSKESFKGNYNNNFVTLEGVEDMLSFKPELVCRNITVPSLFLHGELDTIVSLDESKSLYNMVSSNHKVLKIVPGIDHNMPIHQRREEVFEIIIDWFLQHL